MKRALTFLFLFVAMRCFAITADIIIIPDYGARGMLTRAVLSNIVVGAHGTLSYQEGTQLGGGSATTWQRTYIDHTNSALAFQSLVTVTGTNYNGNSTNLIRFDAVTNLPDEFVNIQLRGDGASTITNLLVGALRNLAITNTTISDINLDLITLYDSTGGSWAVAEMKAFPNSGSIEIYAHAAFGQTSVDGAPIALIQAKDYFFLLYRDVIGSRACLRVYDATSWALVGESICSMNVGNTYLMQFPVGYIGNPPLNTYSGPTFVKFDANNTDYTNLISTPAPVTFSAGVATIGGMTSQ